MRPAFYSLAWVFLFGNLGLPASGAEGPSQKLAPFAGEVRYHFREKIPDAKPGKKQVSAPSHERERLPLSRATIANGASVELVSGRVRHLPYRFVLKIIRRKGAPQETLEVNIMDRSGKPLAGFPQRMPNPLARTADSSRKDFEIPVSRSLRKKIEKSLLARGQFLTYVSLIVGVDDDFLSSAGAR